MTKVDKTDPGYVRYSPVEAERFAGLLPGYIGTAEFDCLHDDGTLYADLLQKANIEVTMNETTTQAAIAQQIAFMKRMIERKDEEGLFWQVL